MEIKERSQVAPWGRRRRVCMHGGGDPFAHCARAVRDRVIDGAVVRSAPSPPRSAEADLALPSGEGERLIPERRPAFLELRPEPHGRDAQGETGAVLDLDREAAERALAGGRLEARARRLLQ